MSVNAELALAASRTRELSSRIPPEHRPDVAAAWAQLLAQVGDARSDGAKVLAIYEWRERFEGRLAAALAHAPIEPVGARR